MLTVMGASLTPLCDPPVLWLAARFGCRKVRMTGGGVDEREREREKLESD